MPFRTEMPIRNALMAAAVQKGGPFQLQLDRRESIATSGSRYLHNRLQTALERKRSSLRANLMSTSNESKMCDEEMDAFMEEYRAEPEHVLMYALAHHLGQDKSQELFERGFDVRVKQGRYDLILGDLIPAELEKERRRRLAHRRYLDGTNATAAGDLDVYLERHGQARNQIRGKPGLATGFKELDDALGGGLDGVCFLGGLAGSGKSSLAGQIMLAALRRSGSRCIGADARKQNGQERMAESAPMSWGKRRSGNVRVGRTFAGS